MQKQNPVIKNYIWNPFPYKLSSCKQIKSEQLLEVVYVKNSKCKVRF